MIARELPPTASATIDRTVAAVGREIPRIAVLQRRDLLAEVRDGLMDATEAHVAAGLSATESERRAVAEFGDPGPIGRALASTVAARATRRAAVVLGPGYLAMLLGWALFGHGGAHQLSPVQSAAVASFGWMGVVAVVVAGAALLGSRRIRARSAARMVGGAGVALTLGTWLASQLVAPWAVPPTVALVHVSPLEAVSFATTVAILASSTYALALNRVAFPA